MGINLSKPEGYVPTDGLHDDGVGRYPDFNTQPRYWQDDPFELKPKVDRRKLTSLPPNEESSQLDPAERAAAAAAFASAAASAHKACYPEGMPRLSTGLMLQRELKASDSRRKTPRRVKDGASSKIAASPDVAPQEVPSHGDSVQPIEFLEITSLDKVAQKSGEHADVHDDAVIVNAKPDTVPALTNDTSKKTESDGDAHQVNAPRQHAGGDAVQEGAPQEVANHVIASPEQRVFKEEPQAVGSRQNELQAERPRQNEPQAEGPRKSEPQAERPRQNEPQAEGPRQSEPQTERPRQNEPQAERPRLNEPQAEVPRQNEPQAERPRQSEPQAERPRQSEPQAERPRQSEPQAERPCQSEPQAERSRQNEPQAEGPRQNEPQAERPRQNEPQAGGPRQNDNHAEGPRLHEPQAERPRLNEPQAERPRRRDCGDAVPEAVAHETVLQDRVSANREVVPVTDGGDN